MTDMLTTIRPASDADDEAPHPPRPTGLYARLYEPARQALIEPPVPTPAPEPLVEAPIEHHVEPPQLEEPVSAPVQSAPPQSTPVQSAPVQSAMATPTRRHWVLRGLRFAGRAVMFVLMAALLLITIGPRLVGFETFYIRSGSMRPGLPVGALVIATRVPAANLHVGDVIVFSRPDSPSDMVTHRIVGVEDSPTGKQFVTKGDANAVPDPWRVQAAGVGWRESFSIPKLGYAVGYTRVALGSIGLFGAAIIMLTVMALAAIWRSPSESEPEPEVAPASPDLGAAPAPA
jgi:signal peptidase I